MIVKVTINFKNYHSTVLETRDHLFQQIAAAVITLGVLISTVGRQSVFALG